MLNNKQIKLNLIVPSSISYKVAKTLSERPHTESNQLQRDDNIAMSHWWANLKMGLSSSKPKKRCT